MEIQVIEKTNGRINRVTGTTIKERLRVCAYCRVSTDNEEQLNSYQSQLKYYDEKINSKSEWQFAGIYADEAITGTLDFKRTEFGIGSSTIAKELTAKGIKTPKGGTKWCESTIRGILKNEKYIGDVLMGKTFTIDPISHKRLSNLGEVDKHYYKEHHEPIISKELFDRVQEIRTKRAGNRETGRRNDNYSKKYPFSSKLYCAFCGSLLTRRNWNANRSCEKTVWQCIKRAKQGKEECSHCKAIAEEIIEDCFVQGYRILCNDNRKIIETFLEKIENILKENTTETIVSKLEKDKEKINKKLNNLLELNLEGRINKEQYTLKFDELETELIKINSKIQSLLKETNRTESIKNRLNKFKSLFKNIDIMPTFDKDVFECLIDKVIIGEIEEDGTINPYTIRFICKNGSEINCKDNFTATSNKQHSNNTATREKQRMWSAYQCYI